MSGLQKTSDDLLVNRTLKIESGDISPPKTLQLKRSTADGTASATEPWVITFGVNLVEPKEEEIETPLDDGVRGRVPWYDNLEQRLLAPIDDSFSSLSTIVESDRNGETISIRVAFWNVEISEINTINTRPWKILEAVRVGEIYVPDWSQYLPRSVVNTANPT